MEFRRIYNRKMILLIVLIIGTNLFFYYTQYRDVQQESRYYREMLRAYENNGGDYKSALSAFMEAHPELKVSVDVYATLGKNTKAYQEIIKNQEAVGAARTKLQERIQYVEAYQSNIAGKIRQADVMLSISLFAERNTYEEKNIAKTTEDLKKLQSVAPVLDESKAFDTAMEFELSQYSLVLLVLLTVYAFLAEKKSGLNQLIHTTVRGRQHLLLKRLLILFGMSFVYSVLIYGSVLCVGAGMFGGFGGMEHPLQSSCAFECVLFTGTRGAYLLVFVAQAAFFAFFVGMLMWAVMAVIRVYQIGFAAFVGILGVEYVLYLLVSAKSVFKLLHYINLFQCVAVVGTLNTYENWGYGGFVVSVSQTAAILSVLMVLILLVVILAASWKKHPISSVSRLERLLAFLSAVRMKVTEKFPPFFTEMHKLFIWQKGLWILVILCIMVRMNPLEPRNEGLFESIGIGQFYQRAYGLGLGEKLDGIVRGYEKSLEEIKKSKNKAELPIYESVMAQIYEERAYLEAQKAKGRDAVIFGQNAYEAVLGDRLEGNQNLYGLLAVMAVILMNFGLIAYEKQQNMVTLLNAASNRQKILYRKVALMLLDVLLIFAVVYGFNWLDLLQKYKLPCLGAPVQSIHLMEHYPLNISIGAYFALIGLFRLAVLCGVGLAVLQISKRFDYYYSLGTAMIFIIPQILYVCGLEFMKNFSVVTLLTITPF